MSGDVRCSATKCNKCETHDRPMLWKCARCPQPSDIETACTRVRVCACVRLWESYAGARMRIPAATRSHIWAAASLRHPPSSLLPSPKIASERDMVKERKLQMPPARYCPIFGEPDRRMPFNHLRTEIAAINIIQSILMRWWNVYVHIQSRPQIEAC